MNILAALAAFLVSLRAGAADAPEELMDAATNSNFAWQRLTHLCDTFGPRFSGSTNLEAAIDWVLAQIKNDGLENVHGEEVMAPHWVRGAESAELLQPRARRLPMLGVGGSVATPPEGITATIKAKLIRESNLSAVSVSVNTMDGKVTLSGTASSPENIRKAVQLAIDTDGVREVVSTL